MRTTTLVALTLGYASNAFGQAAHTHWEPYKNASTPPSVDQKLTDPVLDGATDLHAHYGPDSYPRQWDAFEIVALAKERVSRDGVPLPEAVALGALIEITAARVLRQDGFDERALDVMFNHNPARLLGLPLE